jgi:hypothetical protein
VRTHELLCSFGEEDFKDKNIQQDASEFQIYLNDCLEKEMAGTDQEHIFKGLFIG